MEPVKKIPTEELIKSTVLSLMAEKPLGKITVTEVCRNIGISRGTFYLHFMDCFHVWDTVQHTFCQQLKQILNRLETDGSQETVLAIRRALRRLIAQNEQSYYVLLYIDQGSEALKDVMAYAKALTMHSLRGRTNLSEDQLSQVVDFINYGSLALDRRVQPAPMADEETDRLILNLIHHGLCYYTDPN